MRLADARAMPILCVLGLLSGIAVGIVIILFQLLIETAQWYLLPDNNVENYEGLGALQRIYLATSGGAVLAVVYFFLRNSPARVGMIQVMERLAYHEGHMSWKNLLLQFFTGSIAIVSGQSVGREGPIVHLGSATSSLLGQYLQLPNNTIRILVSCGAAAAIAASFNTPLAGVIFSMEVIMMEYTISSFMPVILAAVSATTIARLVFDAETTFQVPPLELISHWDLLPITIMGIFIGLNAGLFIKLLQTITVHSQKILLPLRMLLASVCVGLIAVAVPEVMSIGYDTVNMAMFGQLGLWALMMILVAKLMATSLCIGLGIPGGLIGPTLVMGAVSGGVIGLLAEMIFHMGSHPGFYAMLGMGAMMGATLNAPLAALVALLELTGNPHIIFPGMLVVVCANLTARQLFGQGSVFQVQMKGLGIDYQHDPMAQSLRRIGVSSVMNTSYALLEPRLSFQQAQKVISDKPSWLVIRREQGNLLMPASDLVRYLEEQMDKDVNNDEVTIELLEVPSKRLQLVPVYQQSTLQQALQTLESGEGEALYVIRRIGTSADRIYGIVTREDIDKGYRLHRTDY